MAAPRATSLTLTAVVMLFFSLCFSCVADGSESQSPERKHVPIYVLKARRYLERRKAYERTMQARLEALSSATATFGSRLYLQHIAANQHGNVLLSPVSVYASLAMALTASQGATKKEVLTVLSLKGQGRGVHASLQRAMKSFLDDDTDDVNDDINDLTATQNDDTGLSLSLDDLENIVRNDYLMDSSISYSTGQSHIRYSTAVKTDIRSKPQRVSESGLDLSIRLANGMFHSEDVALSQHFSNRLASLYGAPPMAMQLADPEVSANLWVDAVTRGTIPDMLASGSVTEDTLLLLTSAFSFWGTWETNFDEKETVPLPFQTADGDSILSQCMYRTGNFSLKNLDQIGAKVLELPYANTRYSLYVFLPHSSVDIHELEQSLNSSSLQAMVHDMPLPAMTVVLLPRFRLRSRISLASELQNMGLRKLFSEGQANLRRMTDEKLYVSNVFHYAALEVNEGKRSEREMTSVKLGAGDDTSTPSVSLQNSNISDHDEDISAVDQSVNNTAVDQSVDNTAVGDEYDDEDDDDYYDYEDYEDYDYAEEGVGFEGETANFFIAERPFLFMVMDKQYDLELLMGRVTQPTS